MGVLIKELANLKRNWERLNDHMGRLESEFWDDDPHGCCPGCGVPGWYDMEQKQKRREARRKQIIAKLIRDSGDRNG